MQRLILASMSPFRKQLLARLGLAFSVISPEIDESPLPGEMPDIVARRLAQAKANAGLKILNDDSPALIIGSDQVAVIDDQFEGKPGNHEQAVSQLRRLSGRSVSFHTAVCVLNSLTLHMQVELVTSTVLFRRLTEAQIAAYLKREAAYNCAGSFKSEGLGIVLLQKIISDDPTALIGLPLISLTQMLTNEGVDILQSKVT